jgi:DNA-binding CsgD family transcriptional regulator
MHAMAAEAVDIGRALHSPYVLSRALTALGNALLARAAPDQARPLLAEAVALGRKLGSPHVLGLALQGLGDAAAARGELDAARNHYADSVDAFRHNTNQPRLLDAIESLAGLAGQAGQLETVLRLAGATDRWRQRLGVPAPPRSQRLLAGHLAHARRALGLQRAEGCWTAGQSMSLDDACALALLPPELANADPPEPALQSPAERARLSSREIEVARLVGQGLTNVEIAAVLVIGRRTVQTHVGHLLAKLGLSSRAQIAVWVTRNLAAAENSADPIRHLADAAATAHA